MRRGYAGPVREGEVGTEIAPIFDASEGGQELAERVDAILRRTCSLARALTGAEQAALKLWVDEEPSQARKYFSLSAKYAAYVDYRPNPAGLGLHGLEIPPGEVIRLTQGDADFTEDESASIHELASLVGETLDALRAARA
jgi:hypothetical protein